MMPSTVRTISRLYLVIAALIMLIGALTIAVFAYASSTSTANCVNRVLGERATGNQLEQNARYQSTLAELRNLQGRASQRAVIEAKSQYVIAQQRAEAYRSAHPAGRC